MDAVMTGSAGGEDRLQALRITNPKNKNAYALNRPIFFPKSVKSTFVFILKQLAISKHDLIVLHTIDRLLHYSPSFSNEI